MKFKRKIGLGLMAAVMVLGLASCGGASFPGKNYEPTPDEEEFLEDLRFNTKVLIKIKGSTGEAIKSKEAGTSWPLDAEGNEDIPYAALKKDYDNNLELVSAIAVPTSEKEYSAKVEWTVEEFKEKYVTLPEPNFKDEDKLWGEAVINYQEWVDGVELQNQEVIYLNMIAKITYGSWTKTLEFPFLLETAMPTPKLTISEVYDDIFMLDKGKAESNWDFFMKRAQVTGRLFAAYEITPDYDTGHGFRAGTFIHDGTRAVMLYAQNSKTGHGGSVYNEQFKALGLKLGDVITVKGNMTYYDAGGNVQMHGLSYLEKVEEDTPEAQAIPKTFAPVQMDDAKWEGLQCTFASDEWFDYSAEYMSMPIEYKNLTWVGGEIEPKLGNHRVLIFNNAAGKVVKVRIVYHIGEAVMQALKDTLDANPTGTFTVKGIMSFSKAGKDGGGTEYAGGPDITPTLGTDFVVQS